MEELERQKEKYDALEKTWMAANQQFMEFQVSSMENESKILLFWQ